MSSSNITTFMNQLPALVTTVLKEYSKPIFDNKFFQNIEYLTTSTNYNTVLFDKKHQRWEGRPYMFCYDTYGEDYQYLYPIILTVNKIRSLHDFISDNIEDYLVITPTLSVIQKVSNKS